jgi:hypothetical protein
MVEFEDSMWSSDLDLKTGRAIESKNADDDALKV